MAAPKGRAKPKGSGIKKGYVRSETIKRKQRAEWVLSLLEPTFETDVQALKAHERARMYLDMIEYVQPKLARVDMNANLDGNFNLTIISGVPDAADS